MNLLIKYIFFLFILLGEFAHAGTDSPESLLLKISYNQSDSTILAVEKMVQSRDQKYYYLLNALLESNLYIYSEYKENYGLVAAIPLRQEGQDSEKFRLISVYPAPEEIVNAAGIPVVIETGKLKEIKSGRAVRNIIQPEVGKIQLFHWDPEKRKLAVKMLASSGEISQISLIKSAFAKEKDESVKRAADEAVFQLMLYSNDPAVRKTAITGLVENEGHDAVNILKDHITAGENGKVRETDQGLIALTKQSIDAVESRTRKVEVAQNLFTGLSLGSVLILMALGLAIIYGLMGIINMAHGEFMMIGAYTTFIVQGVFLNYFPSSWFDFYFWVAMPFSFVVAGLFGIVIEYFIIRFLYHKPLESLLATWGVSLILIQLARTIFGDLTAVKAPVFATGGLELVPQLVLPYNRLFIIALTLLVVVAVKVILSGTNFGLNIRAVTQNRNMSACLGIPTARVNRYAFFLGTGIAGLGGWAITLVGNVVPNMGQTYIVDSFLVVVTGGVGKLIGTVLSGLGMGFMTKVLEPVFETVYGKVIILSLVILFLQLKPTGLFPARGRNEE